MQSVFPSQKYAMGRHSPDPQGSVIPGGQDRLVRDSGGAAENKARGVMARHGRTIRVIGRIAEMVTQVRPWYDELFRLKYFVWVKTV